MPSGPCGGRRPAWSSAMPCRHSWALVRAGPMRRTSSLLRTVEWTFWTFLTPNSRGIPVGLKALVVRGAGPGAGSAEATACSASPPALARSEVTLAYLEARPAAVLRGKRPRSSPRRMRPRRSPSPPPRSTCTTERRAPPSCLARCAPTLVPAEGERKARGSVLCTLTTSPAPPTRKQPRSPGSSRSSSARGGPRGPGDCSIRIQKTVSSIACEWIGEPSGESHEPAGCGALEGCSCAEAPIQAEAELTVQVVLPGQSMSILKPVADYLAELRREVSELRLSPLDLEVIESLSLGGEAEIIEEMSQEWDEVEELLELWSSTARPSCFSTRWACSAALAAAWSRARGWRRQSRSWCAPCGLGF
ncbi:unnamed protein product [Prorocentrum cordatum]|uniref:Uncharacterized protein n=1 Tax=Prorocentrum cordatum TaxID=2364126 RepID=A0ABN9QKC8_9DINO|nr:unnamed protein product [Polarella glacialis]